MHFRILGFFTLLLDFRYLDCLLLDPLLFVSTIGGLLFFGILKTDSFEIVGMVEFSTFGALESDCLSL